MGCYNTTHMASTIKKDYIWNTLGVLAQNIISPILLIIVARINGVNDVGLFSFALSLALIFWAFSIWGARTYQVSDARGEFSHQSYVAVRVLLSLGVLGAALLFCLFNSYDLYKTLVIISLVFYKILESIADAVYGILQLNGRLYISGRSLLFKSLLSMGLFILLDVITKNIMIASLGLIVSNLVLLLCYDVPRARKFSLVWVSSDKLAITYRESWIIIKRCAPIASVIFMSMFSLMIVRYFIDLYHPEEIGYFGILAMPITALGLLITFILQPNVVRLSELYFKKKNKNFNNIVLSIVTFTFAISLLIVPVVYFFGVDIFKLIFGLEFSRYRYIMLIFVGGAIVNAFVTIFINILTIMRHFKIQFYTLFISNIVLVMAAALLIYRGSFLGGVILYAIVNLIQLGFLIIAYNKALSGSSTSHSRH